VGGRWSIQVTDEGVPWYSVLGGSEHQLSSPSLIAVPIRAQDRMDNAGKKVTRMWHDSANTAACGRSYLTGGRRDSALSAQLSPYFDLPYCAFPLRGSHALTMLSAPADH
jgi:hypothetical protein